MIVETPARFQQASGAGNIPGRLERLAGDTHQSVHIQKGQSQTCFISMSSLQNQLDEKDRLLCPNFNLIVRRKSRVNNFFPVMLTLRELLLSDEELLPDWLLDIVLGRRRKTKSEKKKRITCDTSTTVDMVDTFVSLEHIKESFPGRIVKILEEDSDENADTLQCI